MIKNNRQETFKEKVEHLQKLSGWKKQNCIDFIKYIYHYLDSCGYFESDYNIHDLTRSDDWINYKDRDFGRWLLDMALQYNMEQGVEYKCELIKDNKDENILKIEEI